MKIQERGNMVGRVRRIKEVQNNYWESVLRKKIVRLPCKVGYPFEIGYPEFIHKCNLQLKQKKVQRKWKMGLIQVWGFLNTCNKRKERERGKGTCVIGKVLWNLWFIVTRLIKEPKKEWTDGLGGKRRGKQKF